MATTDNRDIQIVPHLDCVGNTRAGRLLDRLIHWAHNPENRATFNFIEALILQFNGLQAQISANTNDGNLVSGLIAEQEQILQEMETYILKCLKQQTKELNEAKRKQ